MTIKQLGGVFGRNPTFYNVTIEGQLIFEGAIDVNSDLTVGGDLYVNGVVDITQTNTRGAFLRSNTTGSRMHFLDATTAAVSTVGIGAEGNNLVMYGGGGEFLRVASSGNVGVNTINPLQPLHVSGVDSIGIDDYILHNGDTNTKFGFSGADTFKIRTGGQDAVYVDSSQNLLVGKSSAGISNDGFQASNSGQIGVTQASAVVGLFNRKTSDGAILELQRDGSAVGYIGSATARFFIHNNYGAGSGFRFDNGNINPCSNTGATEDDTTDLGAAGGRFTDIYATNGTIQTSDRNEKQDIEALSDAERRVAVAAKGLLRKFRWISAVEEKSDEARIHFGIIAQDLQDAFTAEGLDAGRYGMFIHTTWADEETGEERSRLGVRYSELLAFIIAAI